MTTCSQLWSLVREWHGLTHMTEEYLRQQHIYHTPATIAAAAAVCASDYLDTISHIKWQTTPQDWPLAIHIFEQIGESTPRGELIATLLSEDDVLCYADACDLAATVLNETPCPKHTIEHNCTDHGQETNA